MAGKKKTAAKAKRRSRKSVDLRPNAYPRKGATPIKVKRSKPKPKTALEQMSPALAEAVKTAEETFAPKTEEEDHPPNVDPTPQVGNCFNCGADCTGDDYCHGCKTFICSECDHSAADGGQFGPHTRDAHLVSSLDETLYPPEEQI